MNDKLYNLVEKMYIEFSEKFKKVDQRFATLENRVGTFEKNTDRMFTKLEIYLENETAGKIRALYDDRRETKESLATINMKFDKLI